MLNPGFYKICVLYILILSKRLNDKDFLEGKILMFQPFLA